MKKKVRNMAAILLAFAVTFTSFPALSGTLSSHAATGLSARASGQHSASLSWKKLSKKQKKGVSGITVYRNGVAIANISKKAGSYSDSGLAAGTSYTYQVKTYKKKTKKTKMWLNKATGQWQKKKPAKKNRGKSKTFTTVTYKYKKLTSAASVRTAAAVAPSSGGSGGGAAPGVVEELTTYDYLGKSHTMVKKADGKYYWSAGRTVSLTDSERAKADRTVDGEFTVSGGAQMKQVRGATFRTDYQNYQDFITDNYVYNFEMYNGDPNKLTVELGSGVTVEPYNTYYWPDVNGDPQEKTYYYYVKNGKKIAYTFEDNGGSHMKTSTQNKGNYNLTTQKVLLHTGAGTGNGLGIFTGKFDLILKYDGVEIYRVPVDTAVSAVKGCKAAVNGMSADRKQALDIADAALDAKGRTSDSNKYTEMCQNMYKIRDYIWETYTYGQRLTSPEGSSITMTCIGGAFVLETYAAYYYDEWGFLGYGRSHEQSHEAFHLNRDINMYFEAQGKR